MSDFDGIRVKIARAKMHLAEINAQVSDFGRREPKPYSIRGELDAQTGEQVWKVDGEPLPPPSLPALGDALYNFRSALDHLAHQLVKMDGMNHTMKDWIRAEQPCFGPNPHRNRALWSLQEYGNIDKHRKLIVVTAGTVGGFFDPPGGEPKLCYIHNGPVQKDTVVARFPKPYHKAQIGMMSGIAFGEAPALGEDIRSILISIEINVERIVNTFERAFF